MRRARNILGLAALGLAVVAVWKVGSCKLANVRLQSDLWDLAAEAGVRMGLNEQSTDEKLRHAVIRKAQAYDIQLDPGQVTVIRTGTGLSSTVYLAVDYKVRVNLGCSFALHYTPTSKK